MGDKLVNDISRLFSNLNKLIVKSEIELEIECLKETASLDFRLVLRSILQEQREYRASAFRRIRESYEQAYNMLSSFSNVIGRRMDLL